jgi:CheY-like chemotaxis protein
VVLIEVMMPGLSGDEVIRRARAAGRLSETEVLFLAAMFPDPAPYAALRPVALLPWPSKTTVLRRTVRAAFEMRGLDIGEDVGPPIERGDVAWVREDVPEALLFGRGAPLSGAGASCPCVRTGV